MFVGAGVASLILFVACVGDDPEVAPGGGTGACTETQKDCNGTCVSKEDPNVGCATALCEPCAAATNAAPACRGGACSFACNDGFSDCDGDPANGCESRSSADPANCGACGKVCGAANTAAAPRCASGKCELTCKAGFGHCSGGDEVGCETDLSTSAEHCGACGHSCLGGACVGGKCQPFQIASMSDAHGVAVDSKYVYVTSIQAAAVRRVGRDGKCAPVSPCPQDFASQALGDAFANVRGAAAVATDGTNVYWIAQAASTISMKPATGGAITRTWSPASGGVAGTLALGGGKVWWTNSFGTMDPTVHVARADLDGQNVTTVANFPEPVATFLDIGGLAVDGTQVFWASPKVGVYRAALGAPACTEGGAGTCTAVPNGVGAFGVAVDDTYVYWTEPGSGNGTGNVKRALKTGGGTTLVAMNQDKPHAIAAAGGFVYWGNLGATAPTGGTIRRAPANAAVCDGGGCELVASVTTPRAIVAGDDGIYWTNEQAVGGGVWRLAK